MSKDEAGQVMNLIAHPFAEVGIIEPPSAISFRIRTLHNLDEVWEVDWEVSTVQRNYILRLNPTVVVLIQGQEGFIDWVEVTRDLVADLLIKFGQSLFYFLNLFLLLRFCNGLFAIFDWLLSFLWILAS